MAIQTYSIVAGGLGVRSYRQRFTPGISVIRAQIRRSLSQGSSTAVAIAGVHAVDAADDDDLAELPLAVADARGLVAQQHGQVLEHAGVGQFFLDDRRGRAHGRQPLLGHLAHDPRGQGRPGEGHAPGDCRRQAQHLGHLAHPVLAQRRQRLQHVVAVLLLRVDPQLGQDVVLPLDAGHGLLDVGQDRAVQQVLGPRLPHQLAEDLRVERAGDGVSLLLRIGQAGQGLEELAPGVDDLDRNAHVGERLDDPLRLALAHQGVVDEHGLEPIAQGPVAQHRDHGAVHPAAEGIDGQPVSNSFPNRAYLLFDKCLIVHPIPPRFL